jgi:hypothetical protein
VKSQSGCKEGAGEEEATAQSWAPVVEVDREHAHVAFCAALKAACAVRTISQWVSPTQGSDDASSRPPPPSPRTLLPLHQHLACHCAAVPTSEGQLTITNRLTGYFCCAEDSAKDVAKPFFEKEL